MPESVLKPLSPDCLDAMMSWINNPGLYRKCGFQEEGILRDEYFVKGKCHNMARMAILNQRR